MHRERRFTNTLGSTSSFEVSQYLVETDEYAIAVTEDGTVGMTWNRREDLPQGFPYTYTHQQWFIVPPPVGRMILAGSDLFEAEVGLSTNESNQAGDDNSE